MDRLLIKLPVGMAPVDLEKVCDGVAHAFRARECRVTSAKPGRAWLEVHRRDALAVCRSTDRAAGSRPT